MSLSQRINEDLKKAMKAKDAPRVSCLRMLKTAIKNKQVERGESLKDEEIQSVVSSLIRKGKEAVDGFKQGQRDDLVAQEEQDIKILYEYLPDQLTPDQIEENLKEIISDVSASGLKDMGKVMKAAMDRMAGKVQGKEVNTIARKLLS